MDNRKGVDRTEENYDRLWKIHDIFEILNRKFSKFYNLSENLTVFKVIVLFKGRVIFRHIPKKHEHFGIKLYKLCDMPGYTCYMKVYLGNYSVWPSSWQPPMPQ
jgi:hypothetical protein